MKKSTSAQTTSQTSEIGRFQMAKYPEIKVKLSGVDGNAFSIMGAVSKAMRNAGVPKEERDAYFVEATSGDYENVIQTSMKYVNCV